MTFCSQCGNSIDPGVHFCPGCGCEIPAAEERTPETPIGSPETAPITQIPESDTPPETSSEISESIGVIGWMRKLGIMRSGTYGGTYTSAKDMPTELLMDGVFDAEKDLIHKGDFKRKSTGAGEKAESTRGLSGKGGQRVGRIVYFSIMTIFAGIWLLLCLASTNSSTAIFFQLLLWIGLGVATGFYAFANRFSGLIIAGFTIGVFIISLVVLVISADSTVILADPVL